MYYIVFYSEGKINVLGPYDPALAVKQYEFYAWAVGPKIIKAEGDRIREVDIRALKETNAVLSYNPKAYFADADSNGI